MDEGKILIMNLSKGRIGEENSRLLGAMAITRMFLAAMSRIDTPEDERRDFILYVDEFQNFASEAFEGILSEARKYHLSLVLAHQYIAQMDERVRDAVFGNVGTFVSFRIGAEDAEFIEKEFVPEFSVEDLVNTDKYGIILKLMIDGVTSRAFSARTLPPIDKSHESFRTEIIEISRKKYGTPREQMEKLLAGWVTDSSHSQAPQQQRRPSHSPRAKSVGTASYADRQKQRSREQRDIEISLEEAREKFPPPEGEAPKSHRLKQIIRQPEHLIKPKPQIDREGLRELLRDIEGGKGK
jgi:hypothetical protein